MILAFLFFLINSRDISGTLSNIYERALFQGLRHFLIIQSPLEMMKDSFYFVLKALFLLEIVTFLP